jgi:hypothetical protein
VHFFDVVAYSYNTYGICIPPNVPIQVDRVLSEALAYFFQFFCTVIFALILWKKYYLSSSTLMTK